MRRSENLEGYTDAAWAATRREVAARAITSLMQRDHEARAQLIAAGGLASVLALLDTETPGCERVQFYMASLLATLVLDKDAMLALQARGEGPPMFRTTLRQLGRTLARLKASQVASDSAGAAITAAAEAAGGHPKGGSRASSGGAKRGSVTGAEVDYRGVLGFWWPVEWFIMVSATAMRRRPCVKAYQLDNQPHVPDINNPPPPQLL